MVSLRPLFDGTDTTDQLYLIFKARGTPSFEEFAELNPGLEKPVIELLLQKPRSGRSWSHVLKTDRISRSYTSLLDKLLQWAPPARPQARHVLGEAYFDKIRGLTESQRAQIGVKLFDFTEEELRGPPGAADCGLPEPGRLGDPRRRKSPICDDEVAARYALTVPS